MTPDRTAAPPCPFLPLPGRVVLADLPMGDATPGGIVLPESCRAPGRKAIVVAVADDVTDLAPGDVAAIRPYDGEWHTWDGARVRVMLAEDVLAKWVDDAAGGQAA